MRSRRPGKGGPSSRATHGGLASVNIRLNLNNVIVIVGVAVLGLLLLKLAARTRAAAVPVLGDALRVASAA